jgi:hypothetical protein
MLIAAARVADVDQQVTGDAPRYLGTRGKGPKLPSSRNHEPKSIALTNIRPLAPFRIAHFRGVAEWTPAYFGA